MQDPIIVNQTPPRPPRRTYSKEFKIDAVAQCERGVASMEHGHVHGPRGRSIGVRRTLRTPAQAGVE